jgi:hypothetical protein
MSLLALYILYGASGTLPLIADFNHAKAAIEKDVADGPRKKDLLAVFDKAERATSEALKERQKTTRELIGAVRSYDAQSGDIQPLLQQLRSGISTYQEQAIGYRFELNGKMSREEWAKVFPPKR